MGSRDSYHPASVVGRSLRGGALGEEEASGQEAAGIVVDREWVEANIDRHAYAFRSQGELWICQSNQLFSRGGLVDKEARRVHPSSDKHVVDLWQRQGRKVAVAIILG